VISVAARTEAAGSWWMRVAPVRLGMGIAGSLLALFFAQQAVLGRLPFRDVGSWQDVRIAVVHCLLAGYFPAGVAAVVQGVRRTAEALAPHMGWTAEEADGWGSEVSRTFTRGIYVAGIAGIAMSVLGPALTEPGRSVWSWWDPATWSPEVGWHRVVGLFLGFWFGVFAQSIFVSSARLSRLSAWVRVDLFDLANLAPVTRQGLANGLATIGSLALFGLISVNYGLTPMLAVIGTTSAVIVTAALMLPLRGAHRQIRAAKQAELAWCADVLAQERRAVRDERAAGAGGRFADLLAYHTLVERVPEWPFGSGTLTRVVLYSVIPLGSWIASTLVQHFVEKIVFRR
jgi:hypothetical protein